MSSLNKVTLIGRLGKDPVLRVGAKGVEWATFSVATTEYSKKDGERKDTTEWHDITVFSESLVKVIKLYVKKGMLVYLEGSLRTRKSELNGSVRYYREVIVNRSSDFRMLSGKGQESSTGDRMADERPIDESSPADERPATGDIDDDIPF